MTHKFSYEFICSHCGYQFLHHDRVIGRKQIEEHALMMHKEPNMVVIERLI